jgi:hypothetical protein
MQSAAIRISLKQEVVDTTLCDKICQRLAAGLWFSPVSTTNKTDRHNVTEILLKVALKTITPTLTHSLTEHKIKTDRDI